MARITVEDCLKNIPNKFELVLLAAKRARQLIKGGRPLLNSDDREVVLALREIAAGKVRKASKELKPLTQSGPSSDHKGGAFLRDKDTNDSEI